MKNCNCLHSHVCPHVLAAMGLYLHLVPGRLRLDVPGLADPATVDALEKALAPLEGVRQIRCSASTGRALIEYDPARLQVETLLERLFAAAPHEKVPPRWTANSMVGQAAGFVLESLLKLALG